MGLKEVLSGQTPAVARKFLSEVISGKLSPDFLLGVLPQMKSVSPDLVAVFSTPLTMRFLKVLNSAYSRGKLDVSELGEIFQNPATKGRWQRLATQYHTAGMAGVDFEELQALLLSIDFGKVFANSGVVTDLILELMSGASPSTSFLSSHLSKLNALPQ